MNSLTLLALLLPALLALAIGILRPDLRRVMLWAGVLAIPILLTSPLTFHYLEYPIGLVRLVVLFSLGALAAAAYETIFRQYFKEPRRSRHVLNWMLAGPVVYLIGIMISGETITPLIVTLILELGLVLALRRDLVWDVVFSGFAMAFFYVLLLVVLVRVLGLPLTDTWLVGSGLTGATWIGIPLEEVVVVALFGALWGPMYPAFKDLKLKPA